MTGREAKCNDAGFDKIKIRETATIRVSEGHLFQPRTFSFIAKKNHEKSHTYPKYDKKKLCQAKRSESKSGKCTQPVAAQMSCHAQFHTVPHTNKPHHVRALKRKSSLSGLFQMRVANRMAWFNINTSVAPEKKKRPNQSLMEGKVKWVSRRRYPFICALHRLSRLS